MVSPQTYSISQTTFRSRESDEDDGSVYTGEKVPCKRMKDARDSESSDDEYEFNQNSQQEQLDFARKLLAQ